MGGSEGPQADLQVRIDVLQSPDKVGLVVIDFISHRTAASGASSDRHRQGLDFVCAWILHDTDTVSEPAYHFAVLRRHQDPIQGFLRHISACLPSITASRLLERPYLSLGQRPGVASWFWT